MQQRILTQIRRVRENHKIGNKSLHASANLKAYPNFQITSRFRLDILPYLHV